jgi:2-phospho-L-lactate guanylyltransferase
VVVARTGPTVKSRLESALTADERVRLARAMLLDVVAACRDAGLGGPVVVTEVASVREGLAQDGLPATADAGTDMNAAVRAGVAAATAAGAGAVLVLPGDVPQVAAADLRRLAARLALTPGPFVGVVTDLAGEGTNALLLRPPDAIAPGFGPHSARRHLARARRRGATGFVIRVPSLTFDVDTPDDLALLRRSAPGGATGALLASFDGVTSLR